MADAFAVSRRFSLDADTVDDLLMDHESRGWIRRVGFADLSGWALTESGREQDNRSLAVELTQAGVRDSVARSHAAFVELNTRFLRTITNWQIRPIPGIRWPSTITAIGDGMRTCWGAWPVCRGACVRLVTDWQTT
jgi:hypothetical protein